MPATIASLGELGHADWVAAALPPTREAAGFRTAAAKAFLAAEAPDVAFVLFGHAGTVVMADAAERFAAAFRSHPDAVAAYGDLEVVGADGTPWPLCFPAFDYERMLEQGYPALFFALRRAAAVDALSAGAGSLFRLFNAVLDGGAAGNRVVHLPGAIARLPGGAAARCGAALAAATRAHLAARGIAAEVQPAGRGLLPAVRVTRQRGDLPVSVVVMARGDGEALRRCVASLTPAIEDCAADLVVVDDGSADPVRIAALAEIERRPGVRVVRGSAPAPSTARLRNLGAAAARHDAVCFIDDAVAARDRAWLRELASRAAAPDVAAVGALLVGEGGLIRAAGIVLGAGFAAEAAFADCVEGDPGYADMLRVAREVSALSAEAFLVRRSDLVAVGGFDEARFRVAFNEVDLALKLAALGRRIVFSPHARLTVHSRAAPATWPRREAERARDLRDLRAKWGEALLDDRLYSPLLALDARPFTALAMPPRPTAARSASAVAPRAVPSGF
jgi:GT2 family glycosyltransferase